MMRVVIVCLIRRIRPMLSVLLVVMWIMWRFGSMRTSPSLLRFLVEIISSAQSFILDRVYTHQALDMLQPVLLVLWNAIEDLMAFLMLTATLRFFYCIYHYSFGEWRDIAAQGVFTWARMNVAVVSSKLEQETESFSADMVHILHKDPKREILSDLPEKGRPRQEIVQQLMRHAKQEDERWQSGKVSGTVYNDDQEHTDFLNKVYSVYTWSNPLHPGYWPRLNQCEGEVISMTATMLHGPPHGCVTSGGTESIILAIRAHLNHYGKARGIRHPELVCGTTAHAAVDKACEMFGIRKVAIDCNDGQTYQLDPRKVKRRITTNTIMIFSSAPCYPQGVVDPIAQLSDVALSYDIGLHVDCCLGGFVLPFCQDAPAFDFRNPGVTSMSADTHKFAYASKGTSVVVYRSNELRHGQYFTYPRWTGGMYATPTIPGSRPGALTGCAWAALVSIGKEGYRKRAEDIVNATRRIAHEIDAMKGLTLMTPKPYMVVCFGSDEYDIYRIGDLMSAKGWGLNALQSPASIHLCVTPNVVPQVSSFLLDLKHAVDAVKKEGKPKSKEGTAGVYGTVGSLPPGPVEHILHTFTDLTLAP